MKHLKDLFLRNILLIRKKNSGTTEKKTVCVLITTSIMTIPRCNNISKVLIHLI